MKQWMVISALILSACPGRSPRPSPSAPQTKLAGTGFNVVLITIDTLRADHLGVYGYRRATSPAIDAFAREGVVFERAYTYWPKTRSSFIVMLTGRYPSLNGYSQRHRILHDFNPTLASTLKAAGYQTAGIVDNANVSSSYGYSKGFDAYYEVWKDQSVKGEDAGARKLTDEALRFLSGTKAEQPYFLWVHYVNPHAPYTPPAPYNKAFLDAESQRGPRLAPVDGFHDGIFRKWYVPGQDKLGYYIAQYDGEIAFVDNEVRRVLEGIKRTGRQDRTLIILTSDHGESLGEHGYYFDHGEDLFDPCLRIPLIVSGPGIPKGKRSQVMTSTLDLVPTILDTVKVSYPPDLSGLSVLAAMTQDGPLARQRLAAENDRGLRGLHDERYKIVDRPGEQGARRLALYDRQSDPGELRDLGARSADVMRRQRRELELFFEVRDREWSATRRRVEGVPEGVGDQMSKEECERLRSLGYISQQCE